jgi:hypothetical protein
MSSKLLKTTFKRLLIVVVFGISFAYIESAVVVYLRAIFHPNGFTFPMEVFDLSPLGRRLLLTEIGREAATLILTTTGAWLFGRNIHERFAYFLIIFAIWDIFYYVWLKVLIDWPASIMDWDVLFLMPVTWASAVLYPVLVSIMMLVFAVIILHRNSCARPVKVTIIDWLGFFFASVVVIISFCIAGLHVTEPNFQSYFYWPLFAAGYVLAIAVFTRCLLMSG